MRGVCNGTSRMIGEAGGEPRERRPHSGGEKGRQGSGVPPAGEDPCFVSSFFFFFLKFVSKFQFANIGWLPEGRWMVSTGDGEPGVHWL